MPNRFGQAYALTILSPVAGGHTHGAVHALDIRAALNRVPHGADSPLARLPMLHFARFTVIDDVRLQGIPAKEDHLRSKYLVFVADFDGDLDPFLDSLASNACDLVSSVWQYCEAFPGLTDRAQFRSYMHRCQVTSTFPFGAYAGTPLRDVLRAVDTQRRFIRFLERSQGARGDALQRDFQGLVGELANAPLPAPGTV